MAETYGLKSPQPIMSSSPDHHMYIFQSGSKYYVWNAMAGQCIGDYDINGPGGHCDEDKQAGTQIAEDQADT